MAHVTPETPNRWIKLSIQRRYVALFWSGTFYFTILAVESIGVFVVVIVQQ